MGKKVHDCTCGAFEDACLDKAAVGEPLFVLRAHDQTAPDMVEAWLDNAIDEGADIEGFKRAEARATALAMRNWPDRKMPD